jgi:Fe-S-cluster containining protein
MSNSEAEDKPTNAVLREMAALESKLRRDIERGLQFSNILNSLNLDQSREILALVQALTTLLIRAGMVEPEDLQQALEMTRRPLAARATPTVRLADKGDKYAEGQTAEVDCAALIHLCQSRCCTFKLFLTKQDLDEGAARWDYGNPYWLARNEDGYCVHSDPRTRACTIHPKRPHVCRSYDCRDDERVWTDYANRVPAPMFKLTAQIPVAMMEDVIRKDDTRSDGSAPDSAPHHSVTQKEWSE